MLPKAIFFDLDDTIVSFDGVVEPAWRHVCATYSKQAGFDDSKDLYNTIRERAIWYWSDRERHRVGRLNLNQTRRMIVGMALEKVKGKDEELSNKIADAYTKLREEMIHLFPGAEETLQELKKRDVKMALITNGEREKQRAKIDRFRLLPYFDLCLCEGEVGFGKPDLRVYKMALAGLEVESEEAWMVGDNLEWDVAAPQSLGIFSIWNDHNKAGLPKGSKVLPDRIINSIAELLE